MQIHSCHAVWAPVHCVGRWAGLFNMHYTALGPKLGLKSPNKGPENCAKASKLATKFCFKPLEEDQPLLHPFASWRRLGETTFCLPFLETRDKKVSASNGCITVKNGKVGRLLCVTFLMRHSKRDVVQVFKCERANRKRKRGCGREMFTRPLIKANSVILCYGLVSPTFPDFVSWRD